MRTWFITGASRGLGVQMAARALHEGDAVIATARKPAAVTAALGLHENLLCLPLDVTVEAQAQAAVQSGMERFGRIDVLVNNAGYGLLGAVEEASGHQVEQLFATNVFGVLSVIRAVLPVMRAQGSGHIINMSSLGGYAASPGWGVYNATKFAIEGITEALAAELAPLGIKATIVEPGFFRTDFMDQQSMQTAAPIQAYAATSGVMREKATALSHRQPGDPAKFADAIVALVNIAEPPLRLPLGSDALARIAAKNRSVDAEALRWHALSVSTDMSGEA